MRILIVLLPVILTITLAIVTKRITPSLLIGLISGSFIVTGYSPLDAMNLATKKIIASSELKNFLSYEAFSGSWNLFILLFCFSLAVTIALLNASGAMQSYGMFLGKKISTKKQASFATFGAGICIFFDDYFNTLTVGSIMGPITSRVKLSREKLAYIIDSTAAPVCILAPVSTWALEINNQLTKAGTQAVEDPYMVFIKSIGFNFYPLLTLFLLVWVITKSKNFSLMNEFEKRAEKVIENKTERSAAPPANSPTNPHTDRATKKQPQESSANTPHSLRSNGADAPTDQTPSAKLRWVFIPFIWFIAAIVFTVFGLDYDITKALAYSGVSTTFATLFYFGFWRVCSTKKLFSAIKQALKEISPAMLTLILAWSIGSLIRDDLKVGEYLISIIEGRSILYYMPSLLFITACLTSYATGSSWGTFGILIPIFIPVAIESYVSHPGLIYLFLGAILSGSIFGDHSSPISDTTLLSSIGAGCKHIDHVKSQQPYALLAGATTLLCLLAIASLQATNLWSAPLFLLLGVAMTFALANKLTRPLAS